jgi:hypothetical protein
MAQRKGAQAPQRSAAGRFNLRCAPNQMALQKLDLRRHDFVPQRGHEDVEVSASVAFDPGRTLTPVNSEGDVGSHAFLYQFRAALSAQALCAALAPTARLIRAGRAGSSDWRHKLADRAIVRLE